MSPSPNAQVCEAAKAVGSTLNGLKYAFVGGAACAMLGSTRVTTDVDLVVPKGGTKAARTLLGENSQQFKVDKRTLHTEYRTTPAIMIEILTPPTLFKAVYTRHARIRHRWRQGAEANAAARRKVWGNFKPRRSTGKGQRRRGHQVSSAVVHRPRHASNSRRSP